jgi:hypothetical protein
VNGPYSYTPIAAGRREPDNPFDIEVDGPGLLNPLRLVVSSAADADAFVQALNFAYTQGQLMRSAKPNQPRAEARTDKDDNGNGATAGG